MPRANAEDHLIDVASDADVLTLLKLIIPRAAKVPAAITKNFIHRIYLSFMILLYHTLGECQEVFSTFLFLWVMTPQKFVEKMGQSSRSHP